MRPFAVSAALLFALAPVAAADSVTRPDPTPDRRGEAWGGETYRGVRSHVVIPLEQRQRNTGGSDGAGLCVIASIKTNGNYQGLGPEVVKLWEEAQRRPGGYSPSKLERLLAEITPDLKYASYVGSDPAVLHRLSKAGYPIGATMNTGRLYNYMPIAHMVSLVHYDEEKDLAAVIDNNKPEVYAWMPAQEFARRWNGIGGGWAFVWDYPPPVVAAAAGAWLGFLVGALYGAVFWLFLRKTRS